MAAAATPADLFLLDDGFQHIRVARDVDLLLVNLKLLGVIDNDLSSLAEYCEVVSEATGRPIPINYPVVGEDAFRTATGVHAAAVIKAFRMGNVDLANSVYSGVPASMVGLEQKIGVGPMSGKSNVIWCLEKLGLGFQEFRYFEYKSAMETFSRDSMSEADREHVRRVYDSEIAFVNEQLQRLFESMQAQVGDERILWIFTADHGEGFGEHDYWFTHEEHVFHEAVRVPLMVRFPAGTPRPFSRNFCPLLVLSGIEIVAVPSRVRPPTIRVEA